MKNSRDSLPRTLSVLERGIDLGLHLGAQLYVSLDGKPIADLGVGESRRGTPLTRDTIMPWLSAVKPVAAVALAQFWEEGKVEIDDSVSQFVPEFGRGGKDGITLRHVLTHTSGLRNVNVGWPSASWDEMIERICDADFYPDWAPGHRAGYNVVSAWCILGEVIRRIDGRPYDRYVRERIFGPIGMNDSWLALSPNQLRTYGDRVSVMHQLVDGHLVEPSVSDQTFTSYVCEWRRDNVPAGRLKS